jgi:hypothetical protein
MVIVPSSGASPRCMAVIAIGDSGGENFIAFDSRL